MIRQVKQIIKAGLLRLVNERNKRERRRLARLGLTPHPSQWDIDVSPDGRLSIGGCDLEQIAREFDTPLHVVDADRLVRNFERFRESFATRWPKVEVGYSYKTNPLPGALRILHEASAIAEVISHFELWLALRLGVPGPQIVFNGPGKTEDSLRVAVRNRVKIINIDNPTEALIINAEAATISYKQPVGVRVVTSVGWSAQFGLSIRGGAARVAFESLRGYQHIEPVGLHLHLGTGIKDVSSYLWAIREILDFADELKAGLGIQISFFDLGGGFGIPTVGTLSATDRRLIAAGYPSSPIDVSLTPRIEEFADAISNLFVRRFGPADESSPLLFFEPGRVLTGNAQVLLLSVLAIKPGPNGRQNIILDGGRNVAFPPNYEYHEVFPVAGYNRPADQMCSFFGPLCHPGDVLFQNRPMPSLRVGDVIAMMDAGAYFIPNQMNFSNPRAAAVIVRDGVAKLSRARERFEDIVALDDLACGNPNAIDSAEPRRIGRVG